MIEMQYDIKSAGTKVSFIVADEALSLPGFDLEDRLEWSHEPQEGPPVPARFPPSPANLLRLSHLLAQMATTTQKEEGTFRCAQCAEVVYWGDGRWEHKHGPRRHSAEPRKKN